MTDISLDDVKKYLRVFTTADDDLLAKLIESAEDEAKRFTNRTQLPTLPLDYPIEYDSSSEVISEDVPSSEDPIAPSVFTAVCALVKADYEGVDAAEALALRQVFETKLQPYRSQLGV